MAGMTEKKRTSCADQAYRYLARRDHSVHELRRKLEGKGYAEDEVERTLNGLVEKGYLNDEAYCKNYGAARLRRMRLGPARIRRDLTRKGFDEKLVDTAVDEMYGGGEAEMDVARDAAARKLRSLGPGVGAEEARRKIYGHLVRRGFSGETARRIALDEFESLTGDDGKI